MTRLCRLCGRGEAVVWEVTIRREAAVLTSEHLANVNLCPRCSTQLLRGAGVKFGASPLGSGTPTEFARTSGMPGMGGLIAT